jgi:membrane protease YdiL (CAAX protease family)
VAVDVDHGPALRPMGILATVAFWAIPAALLYIAHYVLVPAFVEQTGRPYLTGYLIAYVATMLFFLIAALAAYRLEGNPVQRAAFRLRYRLGPMARQDWLASLGLLVFIIISYFGLGFSAGWLAQWPAFAPHPVFPPEFGPGGAAARAPGTLMGTAITGQPWVAVVFLFGWIFNILGEELWFRGYILPRQERAFAGRAWLANGLMFTLNHVWQPWNLLLILPGALLGAFVVQRRRNTWILIIAHGLANASLLIVVILNAAGLPI